MATSSQFRFRIRFDLAPNFYIGSQESTLEIPVSGSARLALKAIPSKAPLSESSTLVLTGGPYATEESALKNGKRARSALLIFALEQRKGLDLGSDEPLGGLFEAGKRMLFPDVDPTLIHNDIHGLRCFEDRPGTKFVSASAKGCVTVIASCFTEVVADFLARENDLSLRVEMALELYAASHFDPSARPRFLTLFNSIECLISREARAPAILSLLDELRDRVSAQGLTKEQKDSLLAALRDLRHESIRQAGRRLATKALGNSQFAGQPPRDFFDTCYNLRSAMLHSGKGGARPRDLPSLVGELDRFVVELIRSMMRSKEYYATHSVT